MFLFFAPYVTNIFYRKEQTIEYANYFSWIAWTLLMTGIVGGSLIALGFIAIGSVTALFNLTDLINESKLYANWAVTALSLIAPLYCLIHLPRLQEVEKRSYEINRFFSFLIRYIATPFIVLYFIILYAYSAKVLLNFQDWPKGMISWMVIGFSTFGYLTYIFSKSYEEESKIISLFRAYFPYVVPAQILMLAYAIYLRIAQYDLTMNRYFVVIFGVWLALISAYYIFSHRKSLTVVAASLTIITLLISVGPWSVYRLPAIRQYNHLVRNLQAANMMKDGTIVKKKGQLDVALENDIYSEIQYLCDFSRCEQIKTLFAAQLVGKEAKYEKIWRENDYNKDKKYPGMSRWDIINEVTTELEISYRYSSDTVGRKYVSFGMKDSYDDMTLFPLDVRGYDSIMRIFSKTNPTAITKKQYIMVNPDTETLTLYGYGAEKNFSLREFDTSLAQKYKGLENTFVSAEDLTWTGTSGGIKLRVIFQNYGFKNPNANTADTQYNFVNISGYALIKE